VSAAQVAIIDSGGANLASLEFAIQRLGATAIVTTDARTIAAADRVLLPGVGSAGDAMQRLRAQSLVEPIRALRQPVMGICLGMQLLFEYSAEDSADCLGILPGNVAKIAYRPGLPVPHMGWNQLSVRTPDPLLAGIASGEYVYFVHSYAASPSPVTIATTDYGTPIAAVVRQANFYGTQFHPERSSGVGARILRNFLEL
jgi:imidazole glycerol-phosphate synthase subunit HisH